MESKTYYIYHIPNYVRLNGKIGKIGCSTKPAIRVAKQGFTDYTILEEHSCIYEASKRERELQKEWGYPVDKRPYYETVQIASAGGKIGGKISGRMNVQSGHLASIQSAGGKKGGKLGGKIVGKLYGKINGRKNVESGHLASIQSAGGKAGGKVTGAIRVQCPYCDMISTPGGIGSHKRKCKHRPIC